MLAYLDDTNVGRQTITELDVDDVAYDQVFGSCGLLLAAAHHDSLLRHHVLERVHDTRRLGLLKVREYARENDDHGERHAQPQVVLGRVIVRRLGDAVGEEAEERAEPEEHGETAEQVLAEFHPLGHGLGRRESVRTVAFKHFGGARFRETLIFRISNEIV